MLICALMLISRVHFLNDFLFLAGPEGSREKHSKFRHNELELSRIVFLDRDIIGHEAKLQFHRVPILHSLT